MVRDRAYEPVRWSHAIAAGLGLGLALVTLAVALLAALGCASAASSWRPFRQVGIVVDKALVVMPPALPGLLARDRYVLFVGLDHQTYRGDVTAEFFMSVDRGDCVVVTGQSRGGDLRRIVLSLPCQRRADGSQGSST